MSEQRLLTDRLRDSAGRDSAPQLHASAAPRSFARICVAVHEPVPRQSRRAAAPARSTCPLSAHVSANRLLGNWPVADWAVRQTVTPATQDPQQSAVHVCLLSTSHGMRVRALPEGACASVRAGHTCVAGGLGSCPRALAHFLSERSPHGMERGRGCRVQALMHVPQPP